MSFSIRMMVWGAAKEFGYIGRTQIDFGPFVWISKWVDVNYQIIPPQIKQSTRTARVG